jgi:hypothetical protein
MFLKRYRTPLLLFLAIFALGFGKYLREKNNPHIFSLPAIQGPHLLDETFSPPLLSQEEEKEMQQALTQSYIYYDSGGQSFIFLSADGKYVIKFFKQRIFQLPFWFKLLPSWFFPHYQAIRKWKKENKWQRDYQSYDLAFRSFRDISGLIYVHLQPTSHLQKKIHLVDREGKEYFADLDTLDFVVQYKACSVDKKIIDCMESNQKEEAKKAISSLVQLFINRSRQGLCDRDPNIATNCGFLGDKAIKIDVGRFSLRPPFSPWELKEELSFVFAPFLNWLKQRYPELAHHLNNELSPYVS